MMLTSSEGGFYVVRTVDGNIFIGDTSLRKYMPKYNKDQWATETISHLDAKHA